MTPAWPVGVPLTGPAGLQKSSKSITTVSSIRVEDWQIMATKTTSEDTVKDNTSNGLKLIGEVIVPGASQFADGHMKSGSIHLLGALASVAILGGPGGILVSALIRGNSYTTSTLNKSIFAALFEKKHAATPPATT